MVAATSPGTHAHHSERHSERTDAYLGLPPSRLVGDNLWDVWKELMFSIMKNTVPIPAGISRIRRHVPDDVDSGSALACSIIGAANIIPGFPHRCCAGVLNLLVVLLFLVTRLMGVGVFTGSPGPLGTGRH